MKRGTTMEGLSKVTSDELFGAKAESLAVCESAF